MKSLLTGATKSSFAEEVGGGRKRQRMEEKERGGVREGRRGRGEGGRRERMCSCRLKLTVIPPLVVVTQRKDEGDLILFPDIR